MREFRDIVNDVIAAISDIEVPVNVVTEFENTLMDAPLRKPTIVIGISEINMNTSPLGLYEGKVNGVERYSMPVELKLSANIYLPKTLSGKISYDILSMITSALLDSETVVFKVTGEPMRYDRNFLCVVLPATLHIHERALGNY